LIKNKPKRRTIRFKTRPVHFALSFAAALVLLLVTANVECPAEFKFSGVFYAAFCVGASRGGTLNRPCCMPVPGSAVSCASSFIKIKLLKSDEYALFG
jgi:hypothetical protein